MKYIILLFTLIPTLAAAAITEINIAKLVYGVKAEKIFIDQSVDVAVETKSTRVELPILISVSRVKIFFTPSQGTMIIKGILDDKQIILKEIEIVGSEEGISLQLPNTKVNGIVFEWISKNDKPLLAIKEIEIYTKDITVYSDLSMAAGAEGSSSTVVFSPTNLPQSRPISN